MHLSDWRNTAVTQRRVQEDEDGIMNAEARCGSGGSGEAVAEEGVAGEASGGDEVVWCL